MYLPEPHVLGWALKLWRTRPTQALLSVLGIVVGVAGLVLVMAVGNGAEREMATALGSLGSGTVILRDTGSAALDDRRASRIEALLTPLIEDISKTAHRQGSVTAGHQRVESVRRFGVDSRYAAIYGLQVSTGRFVTAYDVIHRQPVCVLGSGLGRELFPRRQVIGQVLRYGDDWCTVVGLLADDGVRLPELEGLGVSGANRALYLPLTTLVGRTRDYRLQELTVRFRDEAHLSAGLASLRHVASRGSARGTIDMILPVELLRQKHRLQQVLQYLLLGMAFILLVVGGTGIMNNMLLNVLSRRPEIGLRRALGATRGDIITQFVCESSVISLAGGLAGMITGYLASLALNELTAWHTAFAVDTAAAGFGVSLLIGVVFGSYPALQAAAMSPVQSLHEL